MLRAREESCHGLNVRGVPNLPSDLSSDEKLVPMQDHQTYPLQSFFSMCELIFSI